MVGPSSTRSDSHIAGAWIVLAAVAVGLATREGLVVKLAGFALGSALCLFAAPWLTRHYPFFKGTPSWRGRDLDLEPLARKWMPPLLLAVFAASLLWPLVIGSMPRSQDHMVHLTRAWIFVSQLLGNGRISGWSSYWFAGYPAGQLYPPGTDIWVSLFRFLHWGLPDWAFSYAHAYLAFTVLGALSLYWLGLRATGSRLAGLLAGVFWLIDPGAYREGGWSFTVYWGVWSQVLGLIFAVLALASLDRLLDEPSPRWVAAVALTAGFSMLGHPMSLPTLAVLVPSLICCRWLCREWPERGLAPATGALLLGALLALWWLLPFMSRGEWTIKVPELWRSMEQASENVLRGTPFTHLWPVVGVLGLLGALRAAQERRPLLLSLVVSGAIFLFGATSTAFETLALEDISASFARLIYQRFALPAKVAWFVLASFGAARLLEVAKAYRPKPLGLRRGIALSLVGGCVCAPFIVFGHPVFSQTYLRQVGGLQLASQEDDYPDYQRFLTWSRERWEERGSFYRIAYVQPRNEHFLADAPVYNHTPAYKVGWTPCTTFRHRPESDDPRVYRALSVRYVVARHALHGAHLEKVQSFGNINVYETSFEERDRYTLIGPGEAELLRFDEEHISIRIAGAGPGTKLTLHVANYADWRAASDGEDLEIRTAPIFAERYPTFMQVDVPQDGVVDFHFVRPPLRVGAQLVSLIALALVVLLLLHERSERVRKLTGRLAPLGSVFARFTPAIVALLVASSVAFVVYRWIDAARSAPGPALYSFADHLSELEASVEGVTKTETCHRRGGKSTCPGPSWLWVGTKRLKVGILERACIWAPPPPRGRLRLSFPDVPLGQRLEGRHGLSDFAATQTPEGTPVRLRVEVADGPHRTFTVPNDVGWREWSLDTSEVAGERRDVTLIIQSEHHHRRQYCFEGGVPAPR